MIDKQTIGFIGCGNMGSSLLGGLLANGYPKEQLLIAESDSVRRRQIAEDYKIHCEEDNQAVAQAASVILLAVKPQQIKSSIDNIYEQIAIQKKLVISIAAGIELDSLYEWLPDDTEIVRVMPNMPAQIRQGISVLCACPDLPKAKRHSATTIMQAVGEVLWIKDESLMDTVTAISGSGPAYYFLIFEIMQRFAISSGLSEDEARLLILQTGLGASKMALKNDVAFCHLKEQVISPGGTTEAALNILQKGELQTLFQRALAAAQKRSSSLSEQIKKKFK